MNVTLLRANRMRSDRGYSLTVYHQYTTPSARCQSLRMIFPKANATLRINSARRLSLAFKKRAHRAMSSFVLNFYLLKYLLSSPLKPAPWRASSFAISCTVSWMAS